MIEKSLTIEEIIQLSDEEKKHIIDHAEEYKLNNKDIMNIVVTINDDEFKKEIVKNSDKYRLNYRNATNIIRTIDDDQFKKEVLNNASELGLSDYAILDIINSMNDKEFKENAYVGQTVSFKLPDKSKEVDQQDKEKMPLEEDEVPLEEVVYSKRDEYSDEYRKKILEDSDKYKLNNVDKAMIIGSMKDENYKKEMIENNVYGLDDSLIAREILKDIKDDNYKKEYIKNHDIEQRSLAELVSTIDDDNYKKEILNNYDLGEAYNLGILITLNDSDYKKEYINSHDIELSPLLVSIIYSIDDDAYKRDFASKNRLYLIANQNYSKSCEGLLKSLKSENVVDNQDKEDLEFVEKKSPLEQRENFDKELSDMFPDEEKANTLKSSKGRTLSSSGRNEGFANTGQISIVVLSIIVIIIAIIVFTLV
ncbi:MAG: hypothetical protein IJL76_03520 [Bacilli bacterium]|nr:hypothetical protein [Bacilli bacterium]